MLSKAAGWALLALLLVQGAAAQAPAAESPFTVVPSAGFSQKGAPPASVGIARGSQYGYPSIGLSTPESFTYIYYDQNGQVFTQMANYSSWQCVPSLGPGGYVSAFTARDYDYTFKYEQNTYCELAVIDLKAGTWTFAVNPVSQGCPTSLRGPDVSTVTFLKPMPEDVKGFASPSATFCGASASG
ncbi:hypothetical protein ABPG75_011990 [Micractinium tetrahymenae]